MARTNDLWFSFNGKKSTDMGVSLLEIPVRKRPELKGKEIDVPGRSGKLWQPEDAYDDIEFNILMRTAPGADFIAIRSWLTGTGDLIISDMQDRFYCSARLNAETEYSRYLPKCGMWEFDLRVVAPPFLYHVPAAGESGDDVTITSSPDTVTNPGTYKSAPQMTIEGTGNIVLTIGTQIVEIEELEDGIIIDSEMGDCFDLTKTRLLNDKVTLMDDDFPTLAPGANIISWTGTVTKITITPRWRDL